MAEKLDHPKSFPCSHGQTIQCAVCGFYTYDYGYRSDSQQPFKDAVYVHTNFLGVCPECYAYEGWHHSTCSKAQRIMANRVRLKHLDQSHEALSEFLWTTRQPKMERRLKRYNRKTERAAARAGRKLRRMPYAKAVKSEFGEKKWSLRAILRRFGYVPLADYEYAKGQLQTLTHNYTVPPAPMGYQLDAETLTTIAKDAVYELRRRERGK